MTAPLRLPWSDVWTPGTPVRVTFDPNDLDNYISVDGAVRRLDFIDETLGRETLLSGAVLRSHSGSRYQYLATPPKA